MKAKTRAPNPAFPNAEYFHKSILSHCSRVVWLEHTEWSFMLFPKDPKTKTISYIYKHSRGVPHVNVFVNDLLVRTVVVLDPKMSDLVTSFFDLLEEMSYEAEEKAEEEAHKFADEFFEKFKSDVEEPASGKKSNKKAVKNGHKHQPKESG